VFSALVIATTTFLASASFAAVEPTEAEVRAWLEAEIERAVKLDLPAPFAVKWTYEDYNVLSADELTALRSEVSGKPFHPKRPQLAAAERQVRDGKTLIHLLWLCDDDGRWRFGTEHPGMTTRDTMYGPRRSWKLSNGTLELFDQDVVEAGSDPAQSPKLNEHVFRPDLQAMFFGSLSATRAFRIGIKEIGISGVRWRAIFEPAVVPTTLSVEFTGRWSEEMNRGFVERMRYLRHPQSEFQGHAELYEGWVRLGGDSGPWAATSVSRLDAAGRTWRRLTGIEVLPLSPAELETALTVPKHGALDPLRGAITIKEVADHSTGVVAEIGSENGSVEATRAIPGTVARQRVSWRKMIGWLVLAAIGVIVTLVAARRFGHFQKEKE